MSEDLQAAIVRLDNYINSFREIEVAAPRLAIDGEVMHGIVGILEVARDLMLGEKSDAPAEGEAS